MATLSTINANLANINPPTELRNITGWLMWRFEHHDGEPKPRKVPYYTAGSRRHGVQGSRDDKLQLTTFDAARTAAMRRGFDGVGLALLPEFTIVALDFDHCMVEGGVHPDVERVVAGSYAEYSPSGEGVRAFFRGNLGNKKAHGEPYGFEVFSTKGFVTFTGNRLELTDMLGAENTIADVTPAVLDLCARRFGRQMGQQLGHDDDPLMSYEPPVGLTQAQIEEMLDVLPGDLSYDEWLNVGMAIHHETDGEGFELWDSWSQRSSKYSTREYGEMKWESFGRNEGRAITARSLIKLAHSHGARVRTDIASVEEFDVIAEDTSAPVADKALRFQVQPAGEFSRGRSPGWMIKGVLPRAELVVLFGESGSGKTFITLDLSMAVARGVDWRGRRTKSGRVVYIAAEGGGGFRNRLTAYARQNDVELDRIPFGVIHAAPNFLHKDDPLEVARAIVANGGADLIVVDTFAQVTPGANENAAEDVGKALSHCRGLHRATGAVVLLVHHAGKDSTKGARGWSGLRAAADAEIEVARTPAGRLARITKQKDGEDGLEFGFALEQIAIGEDEDGDEVSSCVVVEAEVPTGRAVAKKLGPWERLVVEVVTEFAMGGLAGIEVDAVLKEVAKRAPAVEEGKRDTRKQRARRALLGLCEGDDALYLLENECLEVL